MTTTSSPAPSPELTPALRAAISSHLPILFTRRSHTPYIPLPHPSPSLSNRLALTLPSSSDSDIANQVAILSHPTVYSQLSGPPFPYTPEEATSWNTHLTARWDRCVARWAAGDFSSEVLAESGCPLGVLRLAREEEEQGEGEVIGDLGVCRWRFEELEGEERERAVKENEARKVGDPELIWAFGCRSSHCSSALPPTGAPQCRADASTSPHNSLPLPDLPLAADPHARPPRLTHELVPTSFRPRRQEDSFGCFRGQLGESARAGEERDATTLPRGRGRGEVHA